MACSFPFADGEYDFHLGLAQINEIQNACKSGIGAVYARVVRGRLVGEGIDIGNPEGGAYHLEDLTTVIRQGLIGGGQGIVDGVEVKVTAHRANELVLNYVLADGCKLTDAWKLAAAILTARIEGYDPPKDKKKGSKKRTMKDGSTTPGPSPTAP